MSPGTLALETYTTSFPRASGDEPLLPIGQTSRTDVFPARAGMSPADAANTDATTRFPRASGDEPWDTLKLQAERGFSPRERG